MAAIVRLKRRCDEEPAEALIVACKKPKKAEGLSADNAEEVKSVLKFAGTVKTENDCVSSYITKALRRDSMQLKKEYKHHIVDVNSKLRAQHKNKVQENRYKVINSHRAVAINDLDNNGAEEEKSVTERCPENGEVCTPEGFQDSISGTEVRSLYRLYDVVNEETGETEKKKMKQDSKKECEEEICCNGVVMKRKYFRCDKAAASGEQYVYDLYYTNSPDFNDALLDTMISIQPYTSELMYEEYRDPEGYEMDDDEDDSNDESNWRNEYPDSDSDFEKEYDYYRDYEDDANIEMEHQMTSCRLDDRDELSSEEEEIVDGNDVHFHGSAYAKYKARMMKEFNSEVQDSDEEDPEERYM